MQGSPPGVRKLFALDINDEEDEDFVAELRHETDGLGHFFDGYQLTSWWEVQIDLADPTPMKPDLLLIDINFQKDASSQYVDFKVASDLRPYGPILALPYLNARAISGASFYTGNKPDSDALASPWVLIPMGLIAASQQRKLFMSENFARQQDQVLPSDAATVEGFRKEVTENKPSSRMTALKEAMRFYHANFAIAIDAGIVQVTNAIQLRRRLATLAEVAGVETRVQLPTDLYVEFYSKSHGIERILWHSFCADILEFHRRDVGASDIGRMLDRLRDYFTDDPLFEMTWEVFRQFPYDEFQGRKRFDEAIKLVHGLEIGKDNLTEIMRLGVLFANVEAWARSDLTGAEGRLPLGFQSQVHHCLGATHNTYRSWFGLRKAPATTGIAKTPPKTSQRAFGRTLKIPPLQQFESGGQTSPFLEPNMRLAGDDLRRARDYLGNVGLTDDWSRLPCLSE